jgi:hypothetical protein
LSASEPSDSSSGCRPEESIRNADSLKGLVLSLLAKIDELVEQSKSVHEQNKTLLARIDELLARDSTISTPEIFQCH